MDKFKKLTKIVQDIMYEGMKSGKKVGAASRVVDVEEAKACVRDGLRMIVELFSGAIVDGNGVRDAVMHCVKFVDCVSAML